MLDCTFIDPEAEIASTDFKAVAAFLRATGHTRIGWHYITDMTWMMRRFRKWPTGITVLDAGGGFGPAQFLLAEMGFQVVNVDLTLRPPSRAHRFRYGGRYQRLASLRRTPYAAALSPGGAVADPAETGGDRRGRWSAALAPSAWAYTAACRRWRRGQKITAGVGRIRRLAGDLRALTEIPDNTFQAVASLSALEHIEPGDLETVVAEIRRVSRPGAFWAVTTSGTVAQESWFHAPSRGWCFSARDLEQQFGCRFSRKAEAAVMLDRYRECRYLREHLPEVYRTSGDNGMPWGKWNPVYIPVGIDGRMEKD